MGPIIKDWLQWLRIILTHDIDQHNVQLCLVYTSHSFDEGGGPCGEMVKTMDCGIAVTKFKLQLHYYVHFQTNTLGKGINPFIFPAMG